MGNIFVEMKKNNTSVHLATGRNDSAYAAGVASRTTSTVEKTLAISEFSRNGVMLRSNTALYCSMVGLKNQVGGLLAASCSCLKLVSTIQMTGKTNTIPATQATMPQTELIIRRFAADWGLPGGTTATGVPVAVAVVIGSPPSGTGSR